ncbi:IS630 family transposase, partial [Patescibacteria group bacterium]|nr:IS630 family transposase [Patescibacteria group bacterium]
GKCKRITKKRKQKLQNIINDSKSSGREVRRSQAVLLLDQNTDIQTIITLTKYSRRQIFDLRKNYLKKGIKVILDKRKGKPKEILTKKQRDEIMKILTTKSPRDYDYKCDYWTATILGDLIEREYKVKYKSKTSVYILFKQAKFTFHKPGRVYGKRNEQEVRKWRKETKIKVKQALQESNTIILMEDEMVLSNQTTFQKIWLLQEEYPKIEITSKKENRSIYGFLNIRNGKEHAFKKDWQNMYITYDVLKELRKIYQDQKILLIWDKAPWHKGFKAQEFIMEDGNIETIDFLRAAPEENPQEHVWKNGRSKITHNEPIMNIDMITDKFIDYLNNTEFRYSFLGIKISKSAGS